MSACEFSEKELPYQVFGYFIETVLLVNYTVNWAICQQLEMCVYLTKHEYSFHPHWMYLHHNLTAVESLFNKRLRYNQSCVKYKDRQELFKNPWQLFSHLSEHIFPFISMQLVNKVKDQEQITISDINKCILRLLPYTMYKFWHAKLKQYNSSFSNFCLKLKNKSKPYSFPTFVQRIWSKLTWFFLKTKRNIYW